jgi:hypothetical protein
MTNVHSQITVVLHRNLDVSLRVTLVERLQRINGVIEARCDSSDRRHLTIIFRDGSLGPDTLLDYLARQSAAATLVLATE